MSLKFGDVVFITHKLHRSCICPGREVRKEWRKITYKDPKMGILIGFRTLTNGAVVYGDMENPTTYSPREYLKAALVAIDSKHKPVLVLLDGVTNEVRR